MKSLHILSIITWLPTLGAIVILAVFKKDQAALIRKFATAWFGIAFVASLVLLKYDSAEGGMQFLENHQWIPVIGARYQMGVDGVAVLLIVLTTLLACCCSCCRLPSSAYSPRWTCSCSTFSSKFRWSPCTS